MTTQAKICGLSTPEAVGAALEGGAAYLGFMLFARSPRAVSVDLAARLAAPVQRRAKVVAVMVDPDDAAVDEAARVLAPDLIQLQRPRNPRPGRRDPRARGTGDHQGPGRERRGRRARGPWPMRARPTT